MKPTFRPTHSTRLPATPPVAACIWLAALAAACSPTTAGGGYVPPLDGAGASDIAPSDTGAAGDVGLPQDTGGGGEVQGGVDGKAGADVAVVGGSGEVVITEIHYNPRGGGLLDDAQAEWFEVYNPGDKPVDLGGVTIRDDGNDKYNILPGEAVVPPKGFFVFGASADTKYNGGVAVQLAWGGAIQLKNQGEDAIVLEKGGQIIDSVRWDSAKGWSYLNGRALNLRPDKFGVADNDDPKNWCGAQVEMSSGDMGTPGSANSPCNYADADNDGVPDGSDNCKDVQNPAQIDTDKNGKGDDCEEVAPVCGDGKVDKDIGEACDDGNKDSGDGCSSLCQIEKAVAPGAIIFTEILPDPKAVSDENGEWFEVYNTTDAPVELNGVVLEAVDKSGWKTVLTSAQPIVVAAKSYFVLVAKADTTINGGVTGDHVYGTYPLSSKGAKLTLRSAGQVVDEVAYAPETWTMKTGATLSLDPTLLDAKSNDLPTSWCLGTTPYGLGDLGSPGKANPSCAGPGPDLDGDGKPDALDNCPKIKNADQADGDGDGVGDVCDNCPAVKNADQADANTDGVGDACSTGVCGNGKQEAGEECDDGGTQNGDGCSSTCKKESALATPSPGDLVITELMVKAAGGTGDAGEFIEVTNVSGKKLDLVGLKVDYKGAVQVTVKGFQGETTIDPGGYYLFANQDIAVNGGIKAQHPLAPIQLGNSGGTVTLFSNGLTVDTVTYGTSSPWPGVHTGKSIQLDPKKISALSNDEGAAWCLSQQSYSTLGWLGTPGKANLCL